MVANRRGVSALSEHRRQDGWKSTPCTCGSSRQRRLRRDGRGATAVTTPTPVRSEKTREKHIRQQQRKMKNILTAVMKSILVHDLPQPGEEAGSIVFHSSSNTSEIRNDNNEARATALAAAKVSEGMLDRNAEILRLIEERSTGKGEKHKLTEVSKCKKDASETTQNENADGHPKNS